MNFKTFLAISKQLVICLSARYLVSQNELKICNITSAANSCPFCSQYIIIVFSCSCHMQRVISRVDDTASCHDTSLNYIDRKWSACSCELTYSYYYYYCCCCYPTIMTTTTITTATTTTVTLLCTTAATTTATVSTTTRYYDSTTSHQFVQSKEV